MRTGEILPPSQMGVAGHVVTATPTTFLKEALARMRKHSIHHLLIVENDDVCGILADRDIFEKGVMGNGVQINPVLRAGDVMHRGVPVVSEETEVGETLRLMREQHLSAIPVSRASRTWTILTETDLLRFLEFALNKAKDQPEGAPKAAGEWTLSNPLVQNIMRLLSDVGI